MNHHLKLAVAATFAVLAWGAAGESRAAEVNVNISGYLPAPPGVQLHVSAGRPYYVERGERVYLVRDERYYRKKHHRGHGHGEHGRGHGRGHGRHHGHDD